MIIGKTGPGTPLVEYLSIVDFRAIRHCSRPPSRPAPWPSSREGYLLAAPPSSPSLPTPAGRAIPLKDHPREEQFLLKTTRGTTLPGVHFPAVPARYYPARVHLPSTPPWYTTACSSSGLVSVRVRMTGPGLREVVIGPGYRGKLRSSGRNNIVADSARFAGSGKNSVI